MNEWEIKKSNNDSRPWIKFGLRKLSAYEAHNEEGKGGTKRGKEKQRGMGGGRLLSAALEILSLRSYLHCID